MPALLSSIRREKYSPKSHLGKANAFDCGNDKINACLYKNSEFDVTTFVFFNDETNEIIAYCSMACSCLSSVKKEHQEDVVYTYPAIEIKLFGVDKKYQKTKILMDGIKSVNIINENDEKRETKNKQ